MLITGCRPKEAAYLVQENSLQPNDYPDFRYCDWKATMPKAVTKTKRDYKWGIPKGENTVVQLLRRLHDDGPNLQNELGTLAKFTKDLDTFFTSVLRAAEKEKQGVTVCSPAGPKHTMRSVRSWHGDKWTMEAVLAKRAGREPPFNYLQHTNPKTIQQHYATQTFDSLEAGREELRRRETKQREKQEEQVAKQTR